MNKIQHAVNTEVEKDALFGAIAGAGLAFSALAGSRTGRNVMRAGANAAGKWMGRNSWGGQLARNFSRGLSNLAPKNPSGNAFKDWKSSVGTLAGNVGNKLDAGAAMARNAFNGTISRFRPMATPEYSI